MATTFRSSVRSSMRISFAAATALATGLMGPATAAAQTTAVAAVAPAPDTVTISLAEYNRLIDRAATPLAPLPTLPAGAFVVAGRPGAARRRRPAARHDHPPGRRAARRARPAVPLLSGGTLLGPACAATGADHGLRPVSADPARSSGVFHAVLPGTGAFTCSSNGSAPSSPSRAAPSAQLPQLRRRHASAPPSTRRAKARTSMIDRALVTRRAPGQGRLVVEATLAPGGGVARRLVVARRRHRVAGRGRCGSSTTSRRSSPSARTSCASPRSSTSRWSRGRRRRWPCDCRQGFTAQQLHRRAERGGDESTAGWC